MAKEAPIGEIILKDLRLSFVSLFEPNKRKGLKNDDGKDATPSYKCNVFLPKGTAETKVNLAKIKAVADAVKKDKWKDKVPNLKPEKLCLRDGDLEDWEGYADQFYLSCNNPNQPVLIDRVKDDKGKWVVLTKENGGPKKIYSGAYANVILRIWAQDNEHGKRINCSVECVQFNRHGEAFSGAAPVDPNEKFADIDEADADDIGGGVDADDLL